MKDTYKGMFGKLRRDARSDPDFQLTVVGPSGRRPWQVKTEAGQCDYVEGRPVEIRFTHPVHFIPTRKQSIYIAQVRGRTSVLFRNAAPSEIQTACLISWTGGETTEIVSFDGELWWSQPGSLRIPQLVAALSEGEHAAVGLVDPGSVYNSRPAASVDDLGAREIVQDGQDECVARLNRGADGILVSGGRVFVREGAPVYSLWNGYRNGSITSVGTSDVVSELASSRRNLAYRDVSNKLIFGVPFRVSEHAEIREYARGRRLNLKEVAKIDLIRPDLLEQDPMKVQLEATLRKLLRLLSIDRAGTGAGAADLSRERTRLGDRIGEAVTVFDYGYALKSSLEWMSTGDPWKSKFRVERLFVRDAIDRADAEFIRRGEISPFSSEALSDEEVAAISAFLG